MENPALSFGGGIPQNYEEILGPFIFDPYAVDLVGRINLTGVERVLELACGSGRVTRHLSRSLSAPVEFTASDLNEDMIKVARAKVPAANINWATINMLNIPASENNFDLIICQFGVMLVPEQAKALSGIFRVLKKGGKLIFSTWASLQDNPLWAAGSEVLDSFLTTQPLKFNPGPFSMTDEKEVLQMLKSAGFSAYTAASVSTNAEISDSLLAANGFIQGLPIFSFIQAHAPEQMHQIILSLAKKLAEQLGDEPLKVPQRAWVFEAEK